MSPTSKPSAVSGLRRGIGTTRTEPDSSASQPPVPSAPPRPAKPVRFTLDLDERQHTDLKRFAIETGPGTGGSKVIRALLEELQDDPELAQRVRARIWSAKS
jgi:hypothetical protein